MPHDSQIFFPFGLPALIYPQASTGHGTGWKAGATDYF
jgi:hypothetical protein